jgi:hypothetical protein
MNLIHCPAARLNARWAKTMWGSYRFIPTEFYTSSSITIKSTDLEHKE